MFIFMQLADRWQYLADYLKSQLDLVDARGSPSEGYFKDLVFASRERLLQKHDMWRFMNRDFLLVSSILSRAVLFRNAMLTCRCVQYKLLGCGML
jgi:hypothetical protein